MKTLLSFLLMGFMAINYVNAQNSNMIIFTEQGERFSVILNGIRQNVSPETNVKITDLNAPNYKAKIIFENQNLGELNKSIYFQTPGNEYTFVVKRNKKGEYVMRFMSEVSVAQAPPPPPTQTAIVYTLTPPPVATVTISETTTTTVQGGGIQPAGENVSVNMGVSGNETGVSLNINVSEGQTTSDVTTTYSTTTTTTTTGHIIAPAPVTEIVVYVPGYTGAVGCPIPMSQPEFLNVKQSIASKTFEDSKLTIVKQVIGANCLLCSQVKEIMLLFDFEDTRLQLAKFAYGYTYDIGNYYQLNDAFDFESSIDELNEYINAGGY